MTAVFLFDVFEERGMFPVKGRLLILEALSYTHVNF